MAAIVGLLLFVFGTLANASPLLNEPRFFQLSTENGLTQDTVNDVLLDSEGFLWVATDAGLNRYDGFHSKHFLGPNNEFADDGIYSLFEDQRGDLWVSTLSSGIYRVSRDTGDTQRVLAIPYQSDPNWYQFASHYTVASDNTIYIALDQVLIELNLDTLKWTTVFDLLSPEYAVTDQNVIRFIKVHEDVLFIATTEGLFTKHLASSNVKRVAHLQEQNYGPDKVNTKLIVIDQNDHFLLGTVEGLYRFNLAEIMAFSRDEGPTPMAHTLVGLLNIWDLKFIENSRYYMATDQGLFIVDASSGQLEHLFRPSDSRLLISDDDLSEIVLTPNNYLWLSTRTSGLLRWSPQSTKFTNVYGDGSDTSKLSDNLVYSFYEQDDTHLWVGTNNGLNLYNRETGDVEQFLVNPDRKAFYTSGTIAIIRPAEKGLVWLVTGEGIVKFDPINKRVVPLNLPVSVNDIVSHKEAFDILPLGDKKSLLYSKQAFWKLDENTATLSSDEVLNASLDVSKFYTFLPDYNGSQESVLISMNGELWRYHLAENKLTKLHQARKSQAEYTIQPTDALLDRYGTLWISYPGHGLYGLDAETLEEKHFFDTTNLLPTNIVFSLKSDEDGNIWMGSHNGLLKLYPQSLRLIQYTVRDGLASNEFNWNAENTLSDGNFVLGSTKGFTLFDPNELGQKNIAPPPVNITDAKLISQSLPLGIGIKNGLSVELEHNDIGLTLHYSDMQLAHSQATYFKYALRGKVSLDYPPTRTTEVVFPQLEPGNYEFAVSAYDIGSDTTGPESVLYIRVDHPPFGSPTAYAIYAIIVIVLTGFALRRRQLHNDKLKAAHLETVKSENRLSMALKASNTRVWEWRDDTDEILQARIVTDLGYDEGEHAPVHSVHVDLIHEQDKAAYQRQWNEAIKDDGKGLDITYRLKAKEGHYEWYRDVGALVRSVSSPGVKKLVGTYSNITESINTQSKALLFGEAFQHTKDWVVIYDSKFHPIVANQAFIDALGINTSRDMTQQLSKILSSQRAELANVWHKMRMLKANEYWDGEATVEGLNNKAYTVAVSITAVGTPQNINEIDRYLLILSDISQQKEAQSALIQLANYDNLTGLPNRSLLLDRIQHAVDQARRDKMNIGLFFIDLDRFKQVNDSLGHDAGDELLKIVAKRLKGKVRQSDTVARLGGDEFVVMIEHVDDVNALSHLATDIIAALEQNIVLVNQVVSVSASIGIALYPEDALTPTELLKNADIAMYHAKAMGSSNSQYFTTHMNKQVQEKMQLENKVKQAHTKREFISYYQPIVNCATFEVEGFEMLMRWPADNGMIPPDVFIPVAEDIGLIESMTLTAIEQALPLLTHFKSLDKQPYLSINLSARHFNKDTNFNALIALLDTHNISTQCIRFEITESALMSDYESAMRSMSSLKEMGFLIALDDFGTGYSSLKYLKDFPLDILKIDRSFVKDIGLNTGNEAIILATLRMAESLNLVCVAEGIETREQIAFFQKHGCEYLQGYYFSKPVPESDISNTLDRIGQMKLEQE
ncbi:EAL domain-containing protein [Alteromonas sediminis]|nr:EAL domain-containing protein [Alteromonas sediminis]